MKSKGLLGGFVQRETEPDDGKVTDAPALLVESKFAVALKNPVPFHPGTLVAVLPLPVASAPVVPVFSSNFQ